MPKKVIDVSKHNGTIDWSKVKDNIFGAIIRVGYRGYGSGIIALDPQFKTNVKGCQDNNIPFGVYFFPCSITEQEALEEAEWIVNQVKNLQLAFPIYLDSEIADVGSKSGRSDKLSKETRTKLLVVIINKLSEYGYTSGVYASSDWYVNNLDVNLLPANTRYWVAQWSSKLNYIGRYNVWQYTSKATVPGINGYVDMSYYYDEVYIKTTGQLAQEVIDGKWGDAPYRKTNLESSGYNYSEIQTRVNKILSTQESIKSSASKIAEYDKQANIYIKKRDDESKVINSLREQLKELQE